MTVSAHRRLSEKLDRSSEQFRVARPLRHPESQDSVVDCIYIAVSALESSYTRMCVSSVRHCDPDIPIRPLVGGRLEDGLAAELQKYWADGMADILSGEYG
jgi:hypothetical protein